MGNWLIASQSRIRVAGAALMLAFALPLVSESASNPEDKCEGGKNDTAGRYAACTSKALRGFVVSADTAKYDAGIIKCDASYEAAWGKLEDAAVAANTTCRSVADMQNVQDFLDSCLASVAGEIAGGTLPSDPMSCDAALTTCNANLSTCNADPRAKPLTTNQALCYSTAGVLIACPGTGQDGELQKGVARNFVDNGDGTISDLAAGLMWEKQSNDATLHDKDNLYTLSNAYAVKIAGLNSAVYAGHNDWHLPNRHELESLANTIANPAPTAFTQFDQNCNPGCTVLTCSCTNSTYYWSSTTYAFATSSGWTLNFANGDSTAAGKTGAHPVRGVRTLL